MNRYTLKEIKRLLGQASFVKPVDLGALKSAINDLELKLSNVERIIPIDLLHAIDEIDQEYIDLSNEIESLKRQNSQLNEKIANIPVIGEEDNSTNVGKIVIGISDLEKKNEEAVFDALSEFDKKCPYCGKDQYRVGLRDKIEVDHFIPVSRGGQNLPWNLLPVCKECNRKKKDRLPFVFLEPSVFERCQNYLIGVRLRHYQEGVQQMENSRSLIGLIKEHQYFLEKNALEPFVQELLQIVQPEKLIEFKEIIEKKNNEISITSSPEDLIKFLTDYISNRKGEFSRGVIMSPFHRLCDNIQNELPEGIARITPILLMRVLKKSNWKDMGRLGSADFHTKKHIFCAPEFAYLSKSDLRRMGETKI